MQLLMIPAPDPREVARFDDWCRENFGPGCTEPFHRSRQPNIPARRVEVEKLERGIFWRVRWYRLQRALRSREVWLTFVALLLASAFMAGRVFADARSIDVSIGERVNAVPAGVAPYRDAGALNPPKQGPHGGALQSEPVAHRGLHVGPATLAAEHLRDCVGCARWWRSDRATSSMSGASAVPAAKESVGRRPGLRGGEASQSRTLDLAGATYAAEPVSISAAPCPRVWGDSALPLVSRERFEECREQEIEQLRRDAATLRMLGGFVLLITSMIALRWVRRTEDEPEDLGHVTPREPWR